MSKRKIDTLRAALGRRTTDLEPFRNPRDLFEDALEEEVKLYGSGKDTLGHTASQRVIEWFEEGVEFANQNTTWGPESVPTWWVTMYRSTRATAAVAGYLHAHHCVVDEFVGEVYKA